MRRTLTTFFLCVTLVCGARAAFAQPSPETTDVGRREDVTLTTSDNVTIKGTMGVPPTAGAGTPAVILIHQGGSDRGEWDEFFAKLLVENYVVFAYDVRGHGESDKVDNIYQLFNDPDLAPNDLRAAVAFLQSRSFVDKNRIAVVGASIGGNLAALSVSEMRIKTAVAMSGKTSAVYNLAGKKDLKLKSVFYISSERDQDGRRAVWAQEMYDATEPPRKVEIVEGSDGHGVSILTDSPKTADAIVTWLKQQL